MNTPFYIAKRYLFAKKSTNAINIISAISMLGVMVGTAALIIVLSVFNGLEDVIIKMFNTMTPEISISAVKGKTFNLNTIYLNQLRENPKVFSFTEVLEDKALFKYRDKQAVGAIKGVSFEYSKNPKLDSAIVEGYFVLNNGRGYNAVVGSGLQAYLGVSIIDPFTELEVFFPKRGKIPNSINPFDDFTINALPVSGIFEVQQEFDNTVIVPLDFARKLFGNPDQVNSIEIYLNPNVDLEAFKAEIERNLGVNYAVKNRAQQNQSLYNLLNTERWAVYLILTFILVIAIFNIIGSLTMLVIDKIKDISILNSLGASESMIKKIFLFEGLMITMFGCFLGLILGFVFCILQQNYGFISMGEAQTTLIDAYPVNLKLKDFIFVFCTVAVFSFLASALSANLSVKNMSNANQTL